MAMVPVINYSNGADTTSSWAFVQSKTVVLNYYFLRDNRSNSYVLSNREATRKLTDQFIHFSYATSPLDCLLICDIVMMCGFDSNFCLHEIMVIASCHLSERGRKTLDLKDDIFKLGFELELIYVKSS